MVSVMHLSSNRSRFPTKEKLEWMLVIIHVYVKWYNKKQNSSILIHTSAVSSVVSIICFEKKSVKINNMSVHKSLSFKSESSDARQNTVAIYNKWTKKSAPHAL